MAARPTRQRLLTWAAIGLACCSRSPPAAAPEPAPGSEPIPTAAPLPTPEPAASHDEWSRLSATGAATLRQTVRAPGECAVECALQEQVKWRHSGCVALDSDFIFPADDCRAAVVLLEYPPRGATLAQTIVGDLLAADHSRPLTLGELASDPSKFDASGPRVRWLAGAVGEPGVRPHLTDDGQSVNASTRDGAAIALAFSHLPWHPQVAGVAPPSNPGLFRYVDDQGVTQIVSGLENAPARYRAKAVPVEGEISTVAGAPPTSMGSAWSGVTFATPERHTVDPPAAAPSAPQGPKQIIFGLPNNVSNAVLIREQRRRCGARCAVQ